MRILLVQPGQKLSLQGNNPKIIDKERGRNPPLGLLYVASMIEQTARHEVAVLDLNFADIDLAFFNQYLRDQNFDILGVSITTFTLLDALEVITIFKKYNPNGLVIAGGPHVAIFPIETMKLGVIDVAVKREGEPVINSILDRVGDPAAFADIPGICYRMGEGQFINDLDALPLPNRRHLPYKRYFSLLGSDTYSTTMFTSRGCPFHCAFCDRPALGKKFRYHSSDYVIEEIQHCLELGIREFLFYDDTFTVNRNRVIDICNKIISNGFDIRWDIRARVDTVDEEILRLLKQSGCVGVHYGVESGSERILSRLNKGIEINRIKEIFRLTRKIGLDTLAYFMIGNPGETQLDIDRSLALAAEI